MSDGWIKLHRSMLMWEWYDDPNTMRVFLHLLLSANREERNWHGITVLAGQVVTSYSNLAENLNLSVHQIRTAIEHLKSTGEVTVRAARRYSVITVENWGKFQSVDLESGTQDGTETAGRAARNATNKRQTDGKLTATNKNKRIKEVKNKEIRISAYDSLPPILQQALYKYEAYRKEARKKMGDTGREQMLTNLLRENTNPDGTIDFDKAADSVYYSMSKGWIGIYPRREQKQESRNDEIDEWVREAQ